MRILLLTFMILQAAQSFAAPDCSLCADAVKLQAELATVTPDPLDPATVDKQDALIFRGTVLAASKTRPVCSSLLEKDARYSVIQAPVPLFAQWMV